MPAEPNKKAEELLKAYSRRRRAETANVGEMPGVTRNLLQAEVRKQFPAKEGRGATGIGPPRILWLRLAFGSSVLALIAFGLFLVTSPPPKSEREELVVAANHSNERSASGENYSRLDRSKERQQVVQPTMTVANSPQVSVPAIKALSDTSAPITPAPRLEKDAVALTELRRDEKVASQNARSFGVVVLSTNPIASGMSQTRLPNQNGTQASQQYVFTDRPQKLKQEAELKLNSPKSRVMEIGAAQRSQYLLVNFTVETAGDQVRIVDSDGSVYAGRIGVEVPVGKLDDLKKAAPQNQNSGGAANGTFWAKGTNLTLRKEVTLAGTLQVDPLTSSQIAESQTAAQSPKRAQMKPVQQRAQFQGVARIGTNETQINAISEPTP